jgi:hypothetical protein
LQQNNGTKVKKSKIKCKFFMKNIASPPNFELAPLIELNRFLRKGDRTFIGNIFGVAQQYVGRVVRGLENPVGFEARQLVDDIEAKVRELAKENWARLELERLQTQKGLFNQELFANDAMKLFDGLDDDVNLMMLQFFKEKVGQK